MRSLWALTGEAEVSPEDYLLTLCAHHTVAVTVVRIRDLSLTQAAWERSGVLVTRMCVIVFPFSPFLPPLAPRHYVILL